MKKNELIGLRRFINKNEVEAWEVIARLRKKVERNYWQLLNSIKIADNQKAVQKANEVISASLSMVADLGLVDEMSAGHGLGHLSRDYLHALLLAHHHEFDPRITYHGMVSGALHDALGSALVGRYSESKRVIRHAEASALMFLKISKTLGLPADEADIIAYSMAAHTHYLKRQKVFCSDGKARFTKPYLDALPNDVIIYPVCFTRWCDRLDLIGPNYLGRHWLTLAADHEDYDRNRFYEVRFSSHLRPIIRNNEDIKQDPQGLTLCEHVQARINTQNGNSPYGCYDYGFMAYFRDWLKISGQRILDSRHDGSDLSKRAEEKLLSDWTAWLKEKVEPSKAGEKAADILAEKFLELDGPTRWLWHPMMRTTLYEYERWSKEMTELLRHVPIQDLPLVGDVRKVL